MKETKEMEQMEYFFEENDMEISTFPDNEQTTVNAKIQMNAEPILETIIEPPKPWEVELDKIEGKTEDTKRVRTNRDKIADAMGCYVYDWYDHYPDDFRDRNQAVTHYNRIAEKLDLLAEKGVDDSELEAEALHLLFDSSLRQ